MSQENAPAAPKPGPRPGPRPGPSAAGATPPTPDPAPAAVVSDPTPWGRVAEDGTVFVTDPLAEGGERPVGSYPSGTPQEALEYFGRKYDDLAATVALCEQRLATPASPVKDIARNLAAVGEQLADAAVVGDLTCLRARVEAAHGLLEERRRADEEARRQAKEEATRARELIVQEAETIAATDPSRMQWKNSGERMQALFEAWRTAQREGAKLDKPVENELWRRFSHARTTFDRGRKHFFAQMQHEHAQARAAKEQLIAEAEQLSSSTDWGATSAAYRDLLARWKAAGRAGRKEDDELWARFRAAQDVFFSARNAQQAEIDSEFAANLVVKEELLAQAEALLPVTDVQAAKKALHAIGEKWDAAGKVPRGDVQRIERRMRAVEQAIREREDERWRRSNPETRARAEGALGQLEDSIAALERDLEQARTRGDARAAQRAEEALATKRAWLDQIRRTASDLR